MWTVLKLLHSHCRTIVQTERSINFLLTASVEDSSQSSHAKNTSISIVANFSRRHHENHLFIPKRFPYYLCVYMQATPTRPHGSRMLKQACPSLPSKHCSPLFSYCSLTLTLPLPYCSKTSFNLI